MRSVRYAVSFGVTFALLASVLVSSALSAQAPPTASTTSWSVDKVVSPNGGWGSECEPDNCGIGTVQLAHIPAAAMANGATVVVQVTMDIKTTNGSDAVVRSSLDPAAVGVLSMRPTSYRVTAPQWTTTTIRWVRHGVEPADGGYDVHLTASPGRGATSADKTIRTLGQSLTVHVSVTP